MSAPRLQHWQAWQPPPLFLCPCCYGCAARRVVWPIGLVLQWRKPTNSWRCGGLRDLFFIFCVMLVAKLEGAPYNWAATFAVPWCVMGVCLLLATMVSAVAWCVAGKEGGRGHSGGVRPARNTLWPHTFVPPMRRPAHCTQLVYPLLQWTIYLIAILIHPTYHIKLPQLAWGVSLCFAAPAVQLPSFLFAARYLDGNSSVTLLVRERGDGEAMHARGCCCSAAAGRLPGNLVALHPPAARTSRLR